MPKKKKTPPVNATLKALDGFVNKLARLGLNAPNIMNANEYQMERLSHNFTQLDALYRTNWIVGRIIDVVAEDMVKNWYQLDCVITPEDIKRITHLERKTQLRAKITEGLQFGRLYGGAAGIIMIEGHEDILDEPLRLDDIMPGSFKGLIILDRWTGITPNMELVTDISSPAFGLPEYYFITANPLEMGIRVHHSRVVRFLGANLPNLEKQVEQYWGASEIERVFDELNKRDSTSWNMAMLVFMANLRVLKLFGMGEFAAMGEEDRADLYSTMEAMNLMMNNNGLQIIGEKDEFDTHSYSFSGLSDLYEMFMMDVSGAAEIPVTKLFGRAPAGMNATGESDMRNYEDSIELKQESKLRPILDILLPIMFMSEFGYVPDDLDYSFVPYRRPSDKERRDLAKQVADAIAGVYNLNIISQKTALKELRQSSEITGMWNNITDEDIEAADGSFGLPGGEFLPNLGDLID